MSRPGHRREWGAYVDHPVEDPTHAQANSVAQLPFLFFAGVWMVRVTMKPWFEVRIACGRRDGGEGGGGATAGGGNGDEHYRTESSVLSYASAFATSIHFLGRSWAIYLQVGRVGFRTPRENTPRWKWEGDEGEDDKERQSRRRRRRRNNRAIAVIASSSSSGEMRGQGARRSS